MKNGILFIFIILFQATGLLGQDCCEFCDEMCSCSDGIAVKPDSVPVPYPVYISNLDSVTQKLGVSFDDFVKHFLQYVKDRDTLNSISEQTVYLTYFLPMLQSNPDFLRQRIIRDIFSIDTYSAGHKTIQIPVEDSIYNLNPNIDLLIRCEGDKNTDNFLQSPNLIDSYLVDIFRYIDSVNKKDTQQVKGINFYFPHFSFKEKRKMAQFAKSVSLIADSMKLSTIRDIQLYFSFDNGLGDKNISYLCCLADMCDSVFIINNNNEDLFASYKIVSHYDAEKLSVFSRIKNQFYLARYSLTEFPVPDESAFSADDIVNLSHADYPDNNWESYLVILCVIILLVVLITVLYWTIPAFSYYLSRNSDYLIMLTLMLFIEIILLIFTMTEAMSRDNVFNFSDRNKNVILLFPLLLVLITPLIKIMRNKKDNP